MRSTIVIIFKLHICYASDIFDNIDDKNHFFGTMFSEIINEHVPLQTKMVKPSSPPSVNNTLSQAIS